MKFILNVLKKASLFFVGMMLVTPNFSEAGNNNEMKKKVLIAYFSQTGHTKTIATDIQNELENAQVEVDVKQIEPVEPYPEYGDELRDLAKKESENDNYRPEFKDINCNVQSYDLILVGSPTWWYKAPKIVLSFLENTNLADKKVCFFITHGGDPGSCLKDMKDASENANFGPHASIYFTWPDDGTFDNKAFNSWIKKIKTELGLGK